MTTEFVVGVPEWIFVGGTTLAAIGLVARANAINDGHYERLTPSLELVVEYDGKGCSAKLIPKLAVTCG